MESGHPYYDWQGKPITGAQWQALFADERHLGDDEVEGVAVSTVWLGLDHRLFDEGPPMIFETMVFGGEFDQWQWRYATEGEARAGHERVVAALRAGVAPSVHASA